MMFWLITLGWYRFYPELWPRDIMMESVRRTCQAAADLESLDAILRSGSATRAQA